MHMVKSLTPEKLPRKVDTRNTLAVTGFGVFCLLQKTFVGFTKCVILQCRQNKHISWIKMKIFMLLPM